MLRNNSNYINKFYDIPTSLLLSGGGDCFQNGLGICLKPYENPYNWEHKLNC